MRILAIDPGPQESGWLIFDTIRQKPLCFGITPNDKLCDQLDNMCSAIYRSDHLAIEMMQSFGKPVAANVFDTCVWIGRFIQQWRPRGYHKVYRKDIKLHLCNASNAKESHVNQALKDRFEPELIGRQRPKGRLRGIVKHGWSALAIAVYAADTMEAAE